MARQAAAVNAVPAAQGRQLGRSHLPGQVLRRFSTIFSRNGRERRTGL